MYNGVFALHLSPKTIRAARVSSTHMIEDADKPKMVSFTLRNPTLICTFSPSEISFLVSVALPQQPHVSWYAPDATARGSLNDVLHWCKC